MTVGLKTHKMLWGRSGNRCAICKCELVEDATETDDESIVGEECHIVGQKPNSARYDFSLSPEAIDKYNNLVLMCNVHHKIIDDQPVTYTVKNLHKMKDEHEKWVRESLEIYDIKKQRDDETYATYIQEWEKMCDIDNWINWSFNILSQGQPEMDLQFDGRLFKLREWLLSRVWPKRYPELENSFSNFGRVLCDFQETFRLKAVATGKDGEILETDKFYRLSTRDYDANLSRRLSKEYDFHVALVQDLMVELTRAANYVQDMVREYISHSYRLNEGIVLVRSGPYSDLTNRTNRFEYSEEEKKDKLYPGLDEFKIIRKYRDMHYGEGTSIDDPEFWVGD